MKDERTDLDPDGTLDLCAKCGGQGEYVAKPYVWVVRCRTPGCCAESEPKHTRGEAMVSWNKMQREGRG